MKVDTTRKWQILYEEVEESKEMKNKSDYKVDPGSINVDHRKQDTRRDAWDRDYMGDHYTKPKPEPETTKKISNAAPVFAFAFFYICILVMIGNIK